MKSLDIFRTGRHTDTNGTTAYFTEADLQASAEAYDPHLHEAPLVIGHPRTDAPAYGWVHRLLHQGDRLQAIPHQVDPQFADLVNQGRYKKISAAFYNPDSPRNPKPGVWYLRHVGFLGAQPPSIKGLASASFTDGEEGVMIFEEEVAKASSLSTLLHSVVDMLVGAHQPVPTFAGSESYPAPAPAEPPKPSQKEEIVMPTQEELAAREAALKQREEELAAREAATRAIEFQAYAEGLIQQGKLLPCHRSLIINLLSSLSGKDTIAFDEGDKKVTMTKADALKKFLSELPKQVELSEVAGPTTDFPGMEFAAPPGSIVDAALLEIHRKALAYQAAHKSDYITAVKAVGERVST